MTKTTLTAISSAIIGGAVVFATVGQDGEQEQVQIVADTRISGPLLAALDSSCADSVLGSATDRKPLCVRCATRRPDPKTKKHKVAFGWCCDGAFMPQIAADCLDKAEVLTEQTLNK